MVLPHDHKGKSDIVVEMSPITRTKVFPAHTGSLTSFGEFAVLVYYEVMKLTPSYYRIDLVSEWFLRKVSRKGQDLLGEKVYGTDSPHFSDKIVESFLKTNQNKNKLNEYFPSPGWSDYDCKI